VGFLHIARERDSWHQATRLTTGRADDLVSVRTYYTFVEAVDAIAAVAVAQRQVVEANDCVGFDDPDDFVPLLVTEGHHHGDAIFK
jgi:hypothetical protein